MNRFENIDEIIANELSGESTLQEKELLREWNGENPANAGLYNLMKDYWNSEVSEDEDDGGEFVKSLLIKINRKKIYKWLCYPAAACGVLILAVGILLLKGVFNEEDPSSAGVMVRYTLDPDKSYLIRSDGTTIEINDRKVSKESYTNSLIGDNSEAASGANKLIVARRSMSSLELPDGSSATVNSTSWLTFPGEFAANERRVKLSGEAYFDVVEDESSPFVIEIQKGEIVVLGTRLNINSYKDKTAEITLISGKVNVVLSGNGEEMNLIPGQQAVISEDGFTIRELDSDQIISWKEGFFELRNTSIENLTALLSRWYGVEVKYDPGLSPDITISGTIPRDNAIEQVTKIIEGTMPLIFETTENGYIVKSRD